MFVCKVSLHLRQPLAMHLIFYMLTLQQCDFIAHQLVTALEVFTVSLQ
jgi:hypothetical protein